MEPALHDTDVLIVPQCVAFWLAPCSGTPGASVNGVCHLGMSSPALSISLNAYKVAKTAKVAPKMPMLAIFGAILPVFCTTSRQVE